MDRIDEIVEKDLKFDQFGKILMNQGYSNRFVAEIIYPCECLAKILMFHVVGSESFSSIGHDDSLDGDYLETLSMMTPEEMRTRYLIIVGDNFAFTDEQNMVKAAYSTQDELLRLCELLHSYVLFMKTLNSFGK